MNYDFMECDSCRVKPGSPTLCLGCLHNRTVIKRLTGLHPNWTEADLEELDRKFDALCEHLGLEFVFEKVSDGSDAADRERVYVRTKLVPQPSLNQAGIAGVVTPTPPVEREAQAVEPLHFYAKKKKYRDL